MAAAGVVSWQSWETRRSANASRDASNAANAALELARTEERHTRTLIAEGVKTRIDAATPSLTVLVDPEPFWPPFEPSIAGGEAQRLNGGRTYRLPRDATERLIVRQAFVMISDNQRVMVVSMAPWTDTTPGRSVEARQGQFEVSPGARIEGWFDVERSIGEWVEIAEVRAAGEPGDESTFIIGYSDPADTGAIDHYEIRTGGVPITPIKQESGGWQLPQGLFEGARVVPSVRSVVMPRARTYYLSKQHNEKLD